MPVLGKIVVDEESLKFLCRPGTRETRRLAPSVIREANPAATLRVDAGDFVLDLPTALAIRAAKYAKLFLWSEEAIRFIETLAANYACAGRARRRIQELQQPGVATRVLADHPFVENLDPHQLIAVAAMSDPGIRGFCLFDEQGVGKTVMAIHAFDRLQQLGEVDALLIFAPKNMIEEWKKDFQRFMADKYLIKTITGSHGEKYDELMGAGEVYITNYETAHLLEQSLRSFLLRKAGRVILVVDESFFVKNRQAQRSSAVRRLRHLCVRCWVLCGTPAPNNALDVVHQFDVADGGVTFLGVSLPEDPAELRRVIQDVVEHRGIYLRRLKRDVLPDIPQKRFDRVLIPMEAEQAHLYSSALHSLVRDVESVDEEAFRRRFASFLERRMTLFELCSHPGQVEPAYKGVPAKHKALDDLLEELITTRREKVVLWSFFTYSLNGLMLRFQRFNPVRLDGSVGDAKLRAEAIRRFQEDDETMLFVANPAAGGAGITLTRAHIAVYETFPVQTAHFLQSVDRIHRRGQTREAQYFFLLCQDTIEEEEYDRLLTKERFSLELFGDPEPETLSREMFLADLLRSLRKLG